MAEPCSLKQLLLYFLKLGATGFGGPIALVGYMQKDLVDERKWISAEEYREGLALAQLAPGPLAAQLAIYLGWARAGILGATLAGIAFVLPSFLIVLALSAVYLHYGGLSWMQGAFYGIGAAVIAVIVRSAMKLTGLTLAKDWLLWFVAVVNALVVAWTESEIVWVFLGSGLFVWLVRVFRKPLPPTVAIAAIPPWLISGLHGPATGETVGNIAWYFTAAGAFVFGSGLAIVPFLYGGVVQDFRWLNERQFIDAVAVAMITPGPVVITVAFIGYLVAGPVGACVAALGTFLPCYLFTIVPAPFFRKFGKNQHLKAIVDGVTAAATGAIGGAAFVLGKRAIYDIPTIAIGVIALVLLFVKPKKVPDMVLVLAAGLVGTFIVSRGA
jgi:chromate transporter